MKHTGKMTTLAALALTSALFLGACGNGNTQSQVPSSSAANVKTATSSSSSSKRLTVSSSSQQTSSTVSSVETAESTSQPTAASSSETVIPVEKAVTSITTEAPAPVETPASDVARKPAVATPVHLVGTWSNDQGVTITIHPDGTASNGAKLELYDNGSVGVRFKEGFGAALFYAPAGQEFSENIAPKKYTAGTDISKECLVIAQSVAEMAHPLYRIH